MWPACQSAGDLAASTTGATPTRSCTCSAWAPSSSCTPVLCLTCSGPLAMPVPQTELPPACQWPLGANKATFPPSTGLQGAGSLDATSTQNFPPEIPHLFIYFSTFPYPS